uniref:Uncharacterized protein n=1 Tax=Pogona vitticeps TaxID=103695 RepID=A0ABM5GL87_9SAUR
MGSSKKQAVQEMLFGIQYESVDHIGKYKSLLICSDEQWDHNYTIKIRTGGQADPIFAIFPQADKGLFEEKGVMEVPPCTKTGREVPHLLWQTEEKKVKAGSDSVTSNYLSAGTWLSQRRYLGTRHYSRYQTSRQPRSFQFADKDSRPRSCCHPYFLAFEHQVILHPSNSVIPSICCLTKLLFHWKERNESFHYDECMIHRHCFLLPGPKEIRELCRNHACQGSSHSRTEMHMSMCYRSGAPSLLSLEDRKKKNQPKEKKGRKKP